MCWGNVFVGVCVWVGLGVSVGVTDFVGVLVAVNVGVGVGHSPQSLQLLCPNSEA